jgi:glycosyltransferase involved in cell wall biosynthesis
MEKVNKKIAMVISAPFPTQKAYGITTRETLFSLRSLEYETKIFSMKGTYTDPDYSKIMDMITPFPQDILYRFLISLSSKGRKKINLLLWRIAIIEGFLRIYPEIRVFNPNLIWLRDPVLAFISRKLFPKTTIILEVHDFSSQLLLNKLILNCRNIILFPINQNISRFISSLNDRVLMQLAPMGIREENVASEIDISLYVERIKNSSNNRIKIGYVGNMAPGGYSKGIEDLILLAEFNMKNSINAEVVLIGANETELAKFKRIQNSLNIEDRFLKFYPHVSHSEAINSLKGLDILVLPIPKSKNYVGMPIKLLEYIAAGKIVMVADCSLFRSFFSENYRPFFYGSEDIPSLSREIYKAVCDENLLSKLLEGARYASNYTWLNRTKNMIEFAINQH